jgi:hypothetical protein
VEKFRCVECRAEIHGRSGRGRRKKYCRRSAEFAARRAVSRSRRAEREIQRCRERVAFLQEFAIEVRRSLRERATFWLGWGRPKEALAAIDAELQYQSNILKTLQGNQQMDPQMISALKGFGTLLHFRP